MALRCLALGTTPQKNNVKNDTTVYVRDSGFKQMKFAVELLQRSCRHSGNPPWNNGVNITSAAVWWVLCRKFDRLSTQWGFLFSEKIVTLKSLYKRSASKEMPATMSLQVMGSAFCVASSDFSSQWYCPLNVTQHCFKNRAWCSNYQHFSNLEQFLTIPFIFLHISIIIFSA